MKLSSSARSPTGASPDSKICRSGSPTRRGVRSILANLDRNKGNLGYDADWHLFLIDHSRAFTGKRNLKGLARPAYVDRVLWERMSGRTLESLSAAFDGLVSEGDLKALLARRDRIAAMIADMVKKRGPASSFSRGRFACARCCRSCWGWRSSRRHLPRQPSSRSVTSTAIWTR